MSDPGRADRHSHWLTGKKHRPSFVLSAHLPGLLPFDPWSELGALLLLPGWVHIAAALIHFLHTADSRQGRSHLLNGTAWRTLSYTVHKVQTRWDAWARKGGAFSK